MIIRLLLAAAIVMPCLGCASATRGTTESISIASTPPGATADVSGLDNPTACVTPCVVQVKRNADITVSINKPGYEPQVIPLTKEVAGAGAAGFAGNVLVGGVVGMGVDDQLAQPAAGVVADQSHVGEPDGLDEVPDHRRDSSG